ncbi:ATP-binding protein [Candidatus Saccharibacteria bacterium]|nr:ATP-binding protein [Candidatus Saccharibacteria bacterium]
MKQLQLTPPLLIVTMGYPGSGKTFFARQFAELYDLPRISEEVLRYELFEKPLFNADESEIIERIMHYNIEQLFKTKATVICEGMFLTRKQRNQLYMLASKNGYRTLTVWLQTDMQTSLIRATQRDRRNPDSKYSFEIDSKTFTRLKDSLQRPTEKETAIVISGKHAFRSQMLTVLKKIAGMYSESISRGEFSAPSKMPAPQRRKPTNQLIQ